MHLCISACSPAVFRAPMARKPAALRPLWTHLAPTLDGSSPSLIRLWLLLCKLLQPSTSFAAGQRAR